MGKSVKRQLVYGVIYIGIAVAFPALPIQGLRFIGGIFTGAFDGFLHSGAQYTEDKGKELLIEGKDNFMEKVVGAWHTLNPFD